MADILLGLWREWPALPNWPRTLVILSWTSVCLGITYYAVDAVMITTGAHWIAISAGMRLFWTICIFL